MAIPSITVGRTAINACDSCPVFMRLCRFLSPALFVLSLSDFQEAGSVSYRPNFAYSMFVRCAECSGVKDA